MRAKALLAFTLLFQTTFSTQAVMEYNSAITAPGGRFGAPRYTTALLPGCTGGDNVGALAYDTTAASFKGCSGAAWAAVGGGGTGDVVGPASSTDTAIARFNGATGKLLQNSANSTIDSSGNLQLNGAGDVSGTAQGGAGGTSGFLQARNSAGATVWVRQRGGSESSTTFGYTRNGLAESIADATGSGYAIGTSGTDPLIFGANNFVRYYIVPVAKALTESSATAVVLVTIAIGERTGGSIEYTVDASDATDHQSRSGKVYYQVVNKSAVETCVVSGFDGTAAPTETKDSSSLAASAGTLTYAWAADTSPANGCNLTLNAVSSLTQTTLQITYMITRNGGTGVVTPQ